MKRNLYLPFSALLAVLMSPASAMAADADEYVAALEKAQNQICEAATKVQLWNTSEALLEKAAEAAAKENFDEGIRLANEAALHAELALATAAREKKNWKLYVPK
jgi:uncharacterized UPF0160 family protein